MAVDETFPTYLGDGVYGHFDGYHIWLSANRDGINHTIALEPAVLHSLFNYNKEIRDYYAQKQQQQQQESQATKGGTQEEKGEESEV